jgi:Domain of unknown function (DUF4347)/Calx-beta domain/FG-GAP-like repeat/WD40-like Beta Propeller Repeat
MEFAGSSASQRPQTNGFALDPTQLPTALLPTALLPTALLPTALLPPSGSPSGRRTSTIAFIDAGVTDYQQLLPSLTDSLTGSSTDSSMEATEVYRLNAGQDAIAQITQTLLGRTGISRLQIISHGQSGAIQLGDDWLSFDNLDRYSTSIQAWSQAMADDGDILLYGCNVAQGARGQAFLQALSQLTAADMAASDDLTGDATLGGDWDLEVQTGAIAATGLADRPPRYTGLLAPELVSQAATISDSAGGTLPANPQAVSANGQVFVFSSTADNLSTGDGNGIEDVFIYDAVNNTTRLVSRTPNGTSGNAASTAPVVSADGRYVAFLSRATNLVSATSPDADTDSFQDVYLFDSVTETVQRLSVTVKPSGDRGDSSALSISPDGRYVAFVSDATDLTFFNDANQNKDVFVWDRTPAAGEPKVIPVSANWNTLQIGNGRSIAPTVSGISTDGKYYLAFASSADNLVDPAANDDGTQDIFLFNITDRQLTRISQQSATVRANNQSSTPVISQDGNRVAFASDASNLVGPNDGNLAQDIFLWTRGATTPIQLISATATGTSGTNATPGSQANDSASTNPVISPDGKFVAFESRVTNLTSTATGGIQQIFLRDVDAAATVLVSQNATGQASEARASNPTIGSNTAAGTTQVAVGFLSTATNLVTGDANGAADAFVRTIASASALTTGTTNLASRTAAGAAGNAGATTVVLSGNGQVVVFGTAAGNLTADQDTNGINDVFFSPTASNTVQLGSKRLATLPANTANNASSVNKRNALSDDGQFVVFSSDASNLASGDSNASKDVFRRNLQTGVTTLISNNAGVAGNGASLNPLISGNGQFVAFDSSAANLSPGDTNSNTDVFVWDGSAATPTLKLISQGAAPANGNSTVKAVSRDGRFVVFSSLASNLVAGVTDSNNAEDIFIWDRTTSSLRMVSQNGNVAANGASSDAVISGDGKFVVFTSNATNLVTGVTDGNAATDVFIFDTTTGVVALVSGVGNVTGNGSSSAPTISDDGQVIGFVSSATNLVPSQADTNGSTDIFVRRSGGFELVSVNAAGTAAGLPPAGSFGESARQPVVSGDGKFISFVSNATDLTANDANGADLDVFLRDLTLNTTTLVSAKPDGQSSPGRSDNPVISSDGRFVLFTSAATGLDTRDTNGNIQDVFLWDRTVNKVRILSLNRTDDGSGNLESRNPAISRDGSYTVFETEAANAIVGDFNAAADVVGASVRPSVSLTVTDGTAIEAAAPTDVGTYQLSRSDTTDAITVKLTLDPITSTAAATDFVLTANNGATPITVTSATAGNYELSIPAGVAAVQLTVTAVDDTAAEPAEVVQLKLVADPLYATRNVANATGITIADQDTNVTSLADAGEGSLRQAILNANATPGPNLINFLLPGTGAQTINLVTVLPDITDAVTIDGTSQAGFTNQTIVTLNGAGITTAVNGLTLRGDGIQVRGLAIRGFLGNGIAIVGNDNQVGSITIANAGNVIDGNGLDGVVVTSGTKNRIAGNSIFSNRGLGINLGADQITPNDDKDGDAGANDLQNFPVITIAEPTATGVTLRGTLNAKPDTLYAVELFNTPATTALADVEGQTFLQRVNVTTDANGNAPISVDRTSPIAGYITATAIDPLGNTSEFAAPRLIGVPTVTIATTAPANKPEGNPAGTATAFSFRISLSQPSTQDITIGYRTQDGTATVANQDYTEVTAGTATITAGNTFVDVTVNAVGDAIFEPNETFAVELVSATGATITSEATQKSANATIDNDDLQPNPTVTITPAVASVTEAAAPYSFNVTLSRLPDADKPVTVNYRTVDGTAVSTAGGDFTAVPNGTVQFSRTDPLTKTITVAMLDDTTREPDETFQVELLATSTNVNLGAQTKADGVIKDNNDTAPTVAIVPLDARKPEGNTGDTNFTFNVSLSAPSGEVVTVNYGTADGTATIANTDYEAATGTLTFNPGQPTTQTVTVKVKGDTTLEPSEDFQVVLSSPTNAILDTTKTTATGRIIGDDPFLQPIVTLVAPTVTDITEGNPGTTANPKVKLVVKLDRPAPEALQVNYQTVNGTAQNTDRDYIGQQGTLNFAVGEESRAVEVEIVSDRKPEDNETFSFSLTSATGATIETPQSQVITILNDDQPPRPTLKLTPLLPDSLSEKDAVTQPFQFIVEVLNAPADKSVTVDYETVDGTATAATDYVAATGTLTFTPGDQSGRLITIASKDDTSLETPGTETFSLRLKNPTNADLDPNSTTVTATILEDEVPPPPPGPVPVPPPPGPVPVPPPPAPVPPPGTLPPAGQPAGLDGDVDLFWRNNRTGTNVVWRTDRTPSFSKVDLPKTIGPGWRAVGSADFDIDGDADIIYRNRITGENQVWLLQNEQLAAIVALPTVADTGWQIAQVGDFTSDGFSDLLWHNDRTGDTTIWALSGTAFGYLIGLPALADTGWQIQGTADFNGDRKLDVLWRNDRTGENGLWILDNGNYVRNVFLPKIPVDLGWSIAGVADVDNDRSQDILWLNNLTGDVNLWKLSGVNYVSFSRVGTVADRNWSIQSVRDFNNDGFSDIIWRNGASGENAVWYLQAGVFGIGVFLPSVDPTFQLKGIADFNKDGSFDYVWNNPGTGETFFWRGQAGGNYAGGTTLPTEPNPAWSVKATGDFNRDGTKDLFWYNQQTGQTSIWLMRQGNVATVVNTPTVADLGWTVGGTGDFDRDGDADLLWYNVRTAATGLWEIQDGNYVRAITNSTPQLPDTSWYVASINDFDRDGTSDILWRNSRTGDNGIWRMVGFSYAGAYNLPSVDLKWELLRSADFNGDGSPDILWRNRESGEVLIWKLNGPNYVATNVSFLPAVLNSQWVVKGTGDFNRDGFQDIIWYNTATGSVALWYINNARFGAAVYLPTVADVDWQLQAVDNFGTI